MDFCGDYGDFGFTFVIPATKKIVWKAKTNGKAYSRNYGSLKQSEQRDLLDKVLSGISSDVKIKWVYEEHKDKRLHVHGIIYSEYDELVYQFRNKFYEGLGYKSIKSYLKYSDIRLLNSSDAWLAYMNKQHIKSKYDEEQEMFKNFEHGVIKIETRQDAYISSLTEHLENTQTLGDEEIYKFGKTNKKYIVEL